MSSRSQRKKTKSVRSESKEDPKQKNIVIPHRSKYTRQCGDRGDIRFRRIVHPEDRVTGMLYPEMIAQIVGIRATNIDAGDTPYVPIEKGEDSIITAYNEIIQKECPLKVYIPVPACNGGYLYEEWAVNDMVSMQQGNILEIIKRYLPRG